MRCNVRRFFAYLLSCVLIFIVVQIYVHSHRQLSISNGPSVSLQHRIADLEVSLDQVKSRMMLLNKRYVAEQNSNSAHNIIQTDFAYPVKQGIIDPTKFTYRINTMQNICKEHNYDLFVYVHSQAVNFARRMTLRNTWASKWLLKKLNVAFVFITGIVTNDSIVMDNIREESEIYGDIVQTVYVDTYANISIKSMSSLNWAAIYCAPYVPIILKSDDDIFVNITRLMDYIHFDLPKIILSRGDKLILCNLWENEAVIREQFDRWFIPVELYDKKVYPPFCQGSALIMTSQAVVAMTAALVGAQFFPLDDVLLTGFTAPLAGVSLIPINSRHLPSLKERKITAHDLQRTFFFVHTNMPNLVSLWNYTMNGA